MARPRSPGAVLFRPSAATHTLLSTSCSMTTTLSTNRSDAVHDKQEDRHFCRSSCFYASGAGELPRSSPSNRSPAAISAMASVMSAVAGTGIHIFTGPVTVPAAVVIPAIVMAIMGVPSCLCTILYGAYRTAGILRDRATATAMPMSMGRCRKRGQSRHQHPGCHSSHKLFISHGMSPPFF